EVSLRAGHLNLRAPGGVSWDVLRERVGAVLGVANFSRAFESPPDFDALQGHVLQQVRGASFASFRVTAKRSYKAFPMDSSQIARALGAAVQGASGARVDLA